MNNPNEYVEMFPHKLLPVLDSMKMPERSVYLILMLLIYDEGGPTKNDAISLSRRFNVKRSSAKKALAVLEKSGRIIRHADGTIWAPDAESFILGGLSLPLTLAIGDVPHQNN